MALAQGELVAWPTFVAEATTLEAMVEGLQAADRWSAEELRAGQARQLGRIALWAADECRHYRRQRDLARELRALADDPDRLFERWQHWPLLAKQDLRHRAADVNARQLPPRHQPAVPVHTSGSTGVPVEVRTTTVTRLIWEALAMREHRWQRRDFTRRLGVVRYRPREERGPTGRDMPSWGTPVSRLHPTGPASAIHIDLSIELILAWLRRFDPHYLLTYPSMAAGMLDALAASGDKPRSLEEVRLISEPVDGELEQRIAREWGARVSEIYSANEVGTIAFRCPERNAMHVQSEALLVEVLDDAGRPCATGQTGRVVVTSLHNLATPLLRYDIGDYATVGRPCSCGRQHATLEHVLGRVRNLARAPDGRQFWPVGLWRIGRIEPITQAQWIQTAPNAIQLRVVTSRPLTAAERQRAVELAQEILRHPFEVDVQEVAAIQRGPTGKFEEFVSRLAE